MHPRRADAGGCPAQLSAQEPAFPCRAGPDASALLDRGTHRPDPASALPPARRAGRTRRGRGRDPGGKGDRPAAAAQKWQRNPGVCGGGELGGRAGAVRRFRKAAKGADQAGGGSRRAWVT